MIKKPHFFNKRLVIGIIILFIGINITTSSIADNIVKKSPMNICKGYTLYVGGTGEGNYSNIQDAIDNASNGDTVFVYIGVYDLDNPIVINKSIKLIGENKFNTIINDSGILIEAPEVDIKGFTIQNSFGIVILSNFKSFSSNSIFGNIFKSNEDFEGMGGILIFNSSYNNIFDNSFFNSSLSILYSYHNSVNNNTINGKPLVYFEGTSNKVIDYAGQVILINCQNITVENLELNNLFISIHMIDSFNCLISNNKFSNNGFGGFFYNSSNNIISGNTFTDNFYGLTFLLYCEENKITKNSFQNNDISIIFMNSSYNLISLNNFKYKCYSINRNMFSTGSDNKWFRNFWNRPRLLPVIIWNFKITNYKYIFILPTSPDIDWLPAKLPNNINGAESSWTESEVSIPGPRASSYLWYQLFFERFPLLERLLSFVR